MITTIVDNKNFNCVCQKQCICKKKIRIEIKNKNDPIKNKISIKNKNKNNQSKIYMNDDIKEFMDTYRKMIKSVSKQTMIKVMKLKSNAEEFSDQDLLGAKICWMVADNIMGIWQWVKSTISNNLSQNKQFKKN